MIKQIENIGCLLTILRFLARWCVYENGLRQGQTGPPTGSGWPPPSWAPSTRGWRTTWRGPGGWCTRGKSRPASRGGLSSGGAFLFRLSWYKHSHCLPAFYCYTSKKKMKIHLICENFRNRVKSCPLALFLYLILENHRDWTRFFQDSWLFFLYCTLFILKRSPLTLFLYLDERESRWAMGEVEKKSYNPAK